jgi:tetratricopeptide (TPR) repeat protein
LGRYYLDEKRFAESLESLRQAVALDGGYAAAIVALGDAYAGLGHPDQAKAAWRQALETPHGKRDGSLQADLEQRISALDEF